MSEPGVEEIVARMEAGWTLTSSESRVVAASWRARGEAMARALNLITTQAQHRVGHGSQSEPLPWISEAYRVIDAALEAAKHKQGSG